MKYIKLNPFVLVLLVLNFGYTLVFAQGDASPNFNPIIPDNLADPSVVKYGDTFYMYATTDIDEGLSRMGIPVVWKSKDFVNWSFSGTILPQIDWSKGHLYTDAKGKERTGYFRYWAPGKPVFKDGRYYLFPTIVKPDETMGTFVVVANQPEGPFNFINGDNVYFGDVPEGKTEATPIVGDIDGEPFVDDDGEMYIYWRRRQAAKMKADFSGIDGDVVNIPTKYGGYSEGPVMFKRNNLYYYIYTLSGNANYCNGYMMSSEGPLGSFTSPEGENIFVQTDFETGVWGPGHGNVFHIPETDEYYFLYLEFGEGGTTRQIYANRMEFNEDGTLKPVKLDKQGVGYLGKSEKKTNKSLEATVTASSAMEDKVVTANIMPDLKNGPARRSSNGEPNQRTFTYGANNVIDQSWGTKWLANDSETPQWIMLDYGKRVNLNSADIYFFKPTYGHAWKMEKSLDGENWETCFSQKEPMACSPQTVKKIGKTRYLKLTILQGPVGVWEIKTK